MKKWLMHLKMSIQQPIRNINMRLAAYMVGVRVQQKHHVSVDGFNN